MIEEKVETVKVKKKKVERATLLRWQVRQLNEDLENKLPNEYKGNINNFSPRAMGGTFHIDENNYIY